VTVAKRKRKKKKKKKGKERTGRPPTHGGRKEDLNPPTRWHDYYIATRGRGEKEERRREDDPHAVEGEKGEPVSAVLDIFRRSYGKERKKEVKKKKGTPWCPTGSRKK